MNQTLNISKEMLLWFKQKARILPWRSNCSPYKTWISEIMLQQTQVKTMLPYYEKFLASFPDVLSLAIAKDDKILNLWQGLGYYSRARNIKKAAQYLVEHHDGTIPSSYPELLKVPGIGPYTAGAIASIAFGIRAPIVDGNILRVFSRLTNNHQPIDQPKVRRLIETQQFASIPTSNCGTYNESLMELGALICTPTTPRCGECPLQNKCIAFQNGTQLLLPLKSKKIQLTKVMAIALIIKTKKSFLLFRRPEGEVMGGMWEFPEWKIDAPKSFKAKSLDPALLGIKNHVTQEFLWKFDIKRNYTKYQEILHVYEYIGDSKLALRKPKSWRQQQCSTAELSQKPLTSAHAKIRKIILHNKD